MLWVVVTTRGESSFSTGAGGMLTREINFLYSYPGYEIPAVKPRTSPRGSTGVKITTRVATTTTNNPHCSTGVSPTSESKVSGKV